MGRGIYCRMYERIHVNTPELAVWLRNLVGFGSHSRGVRREEGSGVRKGVGIYMYLWLIHLKFDRKQQNKATVHSANKI